MSSRRETDPGFCRGEGVEVVGKGERERNAQGNAQREHFPIPTGLENEGLHFVSSCNQQCIKSGVLKRIRFSWFSALRYALLLDRGQANNMGAYSMGTVV